MLKRMWVFLVLAMILATSVCMASQNNDRYYLLISDETGEYYFDQQKFRVNTGNSDFDYDVWVKIQHSDIGVQRVINNLARANLPTDGYENLDYTLCHYQIKTATQQLRTLEIIKYSKEGYVLYSYKAPWYEQVWEDTIPGTVGEMYVEQIHNYYTDLRSRAGTRRIVRD